MTSLVSTQEVVNLMLDKYRVDSKPDNFALFVVYDNGGKFVYNFCFEVQLISGVSFYLPFIQSKGD